MPRINIREIDNTGSEASNDYLENLTLVPGVRLRLVNEKGEEVSRVEGLYTNAKTFLQEVEAAVKSQNDIAGKEEIKDSETAKSFNKLDLNINKDYGFIYTCYLLSQGIPVYYVPAYTENDLINAEDTMSIIPSQFITIETTDDEGETTTKEILSTTETKTTETIVEAAHYMFDFNKFTDKGLYDIRFITLAGLDKEEFIEKAMVAAATRGDAVLLTSLPKTGIQTFKVEYQIEIDGEQETKTIYLPKTIKSIDEETYTITDGVISTQGQVKKYKLNTSSRIDNWVQGKYKLICKKYITHSGYSWSDNEAKEQIGKYAAMFAPDCTCDLTITGISKDYIYTNLTIPADLDYFARYAKTITNANEWTAIAGTPGGISPLNVTPEIQFGDADVNLLQAREEVDGAKDIKTTQEVNLTIVEGETTTKVEAYVVEENTITGHIAINPICNINPFGNLIWGNRTMYALQAPENGSSTKAQLVASSFLNIRNLIISIKKRLYRSSRQFTFAANSDVLWVNFKSTITPLLENMLHNQGIRDYNISKISTTKKALLAAKIKIVPIEAIEDFDLTVEVTDSITVLE